MYLEATSIKKKLTWGQGSRRNTVVKERQGKSRMGVLNGEEGKKQGVREELQRRTTNTKSYSRAHRENY